MGTRLVHDVDPATREVWARRAAELARAPQAEDTGERAAFVVIRVAGERYAFDARYVFDIRRAANLARVPRVPAWVAGVTAIRGRILSVLDVAVYFGLSRAAGDTHPADQHIVLVETPAMELCLLVDEVVAVVSLALGTLKEAGASLQVLPPEYVRGIVAAQPRDAAPWGDGILVVLDLPVLLADRRIVVNQEVAT